MSEPGLLDLLPGVLEAEPPARAMKVIEAAREKGWTENPYVSMVVRYTREDGKPFFARWDLSEANGKPSWRFAGARASNGQKLSYNDIFVYLEDPSVIEPEPPQAEMAETVEREINYDNSARYAGFNRSRPGQNDSSAGSAQKHDAKDGPRPKWGHK